MHTQTTDRQHIQHVGEVARFLSIDADETIARADAGRVRWTAGDNVVDPIPARWAFPHDARYGFALVGLVGCSVGRKNRGDDRAGPLDGDVERLHVNDVGEWFKLVQGPDRLGIDRQEDVTRPQPGLIDERAGPDFPNDDRWASPELLLFGLRQEFEPNAITGEDPPFGRPPVAEHRFHAQRADGCVPISARQDHGDQAAIEIEEPASHHIACPSHVREQLFDRPFAAADPGGAEEVCWHELHRARQSPHGQGPGAGLDSGRGSPSWRSETLDV